MHYLCFYRPCDGLINLNLVQQNSYFTVPFFTMPFIAEFLSPIFCRRFFSAALPVQGNFIPNITFIVQLMWRRRKAITALQSLPEQTTEHAGFPDVFCCFVGSRSFFKLLFNCLAILCLQTSQSLSDFQFFPLCFLFSVRNSFLGYTHEMLLGLPESNCDEQGQ